ncbi:hypothetical protein [Paracnuella aquatica]|uniref:hypothetical protein n=1 Tax=Paracnuella aquatica TaxID=2268757 RepID=UPI000DEFEA30|nr:hypothetical protein [Paracnuella aquatica]RPD43648.1 hypothetical protein DRJ53_19545 [Paracnuella aquatica]
MAEVLGIAPGAIETLNEDAAVNLLNTVQHNTFDNHSNAMVYQQVFNAVEKIVELYEQLLQTEQEKVELLKTLL